MNIDYASKNFWKEKQCSNCKVTFKGAGYQANVLTFFDEYNMFICSNCDPKNYFEHLSSLSYCCAIRKPYFLAGLDSQDAFGLFTTFLIFIVFVIICLTTIGN